MWGGDPSPVITGVRFQRSLTRGVGPDNHYFDADNHYLDTDNHYLDADNHYLGARDVVNLAGIRGSGRVLLRHSAIVCSDRLMESARFVALSGLRPILQPPSTTERRPLQGLRSHSGTKRGGPVLRSNPG